MTKTTLRDEIGDFTAIPNDFIEDKKQTAESRLMFMLLRYHTNRKKKRAFPGYDRLIKETGLSRQKVAKGIKVLESTGWLVKHKVFSKNTEYELRYPERLSSTMEQRQEAPLVPLRNSLSSTMEQPPLSTDNKIDLNKTEKICADKPRRPQIPSEILLFQDIVGKPPKRELYTVVIEAIGINPDRDRLLACRREWLTRGYNEFSLIWLTQWYRTGIPERGNGKVQQ